MDKENRHCKGCFKNVTHDMFCECGEFSLSLGQTVSEDVVKYIKT